MDSRINTSQDGFKLLKRDLQNKIYIYQYELSQKLISTSKSLNTTTDPKGGYPVIA